MAVAYWLATATSLTTKIVRECDEHRGRVLFAKRERVGIADVDGSDLPNFRAVIVELSIMAAVGLALALIGPYGSFAMGSLATRLAYWLPAALGGYLLMRPAVLLTTRAAARLDFPGWAGLAAGVVVAAVPMTFFILALNGRDWHRLPAFDGWLQLYGQIALIGAGVTLLFTLLNASRADQEAPSPAALPTADVGPAPAPTEPASVSVPPFLSRLPHHLRERLIALEMEDHYVRAHGPYASTLVLLRMRDAVEELGGLDGLRVHRSWWVARDAVESVSQDGRNLRLRLVGGIEAPVARSSIPALRAAGWL